MDGMLFSKVLQMSLIGCYSFLIIFVVRLFLKKISHKYCYYLWMIVFVNLCVPFSLFSSFSLIPQQMMNYTTGTVDNEIQNVSLGVEPNLIVFSEDGTVSNQEKLRDILPDQAQTSMVPDGEVNDANTSKSTVLAESVSHFLRNKELPMAEKLWLLGICIFAVYSIGNTIYLNKRIRRMHPSDLSRKDRIVELEGINSPFLWGILHPTIYVPKDMESEEQSYIIAHEKCHRRRRDYLVKIMIYAITVLHWFNPFVWAAYSLCCRDMEISCDESVLENAKENIRKDYARSLLKYAAKQNRYVMTPLTFGEPSVRSRIENVLKFRKKSIYISAAAILLTIFVAVGLLTRPAEKLDSSEEEPETVQNLDHIYYEEEKTTKLPVTNNGGEVIQIGNDIYYMEGKKLFSDGEFLYTTQTDEEGNDYVCQYSLDGNDFHWFMEGTMVGSSERASQFYLLVEGEDNRTIFEVFDSDFMDVCRVYDIEAVYLDVVDDFVYYYDRKQDGLYICYSELNENATKLNVLDTPVQAEQITDFYVDEHSILFVAGQYEGSAGYFNGNFYTYDIDNKTLKQAHITDSDHFLALDGKIYYEKYFYAESKQSGLYCADFDLSEERMIGEAMMLLAADPASKSLLVSKDGKLLRILPESGEEKCLMDLSEAGWNWDEHDTIRFSEVNMIQDTIYAKVELWGYQEGNGWRDSLIDSKHYQIQGDGSGYQIWDPNASLEASGDMFAYLYNEKPGLPCEDPSGAGWNLKQIADVRENFSQMSYVAEEGTEENVYLLGKIEHYTFYGKGDYQSMLLEYNGNYAEIQYPYTSNYMTPLELMETDLDGDSIEELAIKFNIKHGTGVSIDTFLLADTGKDGKLYVYQFLEEDFVSQLAKHLSYEKTEKGIQALVDGQPAGYFIENREDTDPFLKVSIGAQVHFYYTEGGIEISANILFLTDEIGAIYEENNNDITADVSWTKDGKFVLTNFSSRNRKLDSQVEDALKNMYGVDEFPHLSIQYDYTKMNEETLISTAEILEKGTDSYDYAEITLTRSKENAYPYSGWDVENIALEK